MIRKTFELRGKRYSLGFADVEEKLKRVEPRPVTKYQVLVGGRFYPPKQALAAAIDKSLADFTTFDACRVLSKLGFNVSRVKSEKINSPTISEQLFESYLNAYGLTDYEVEPAQEGTSKRPDFEVRVKGTQILFEVKQFDPTAADSNLAGGFYDPYGPIREKIEAARKKFRDLGSSCCCLVLYNNNRPLVDLDWQFVYAAMLGNLAFQMPVDTQTGAADATKARQVLAGDGKMIRYLGKEPSVPQNTTIGAILVLCQYKVGAKRFEIAVRRKERSLGRTLELPEFCREIDAARGTALDMSLTQLRLVVHENPFARVKLPRDLFNGPYDERYGDVGGRIGRIYCGSQLAQLEKEASDTAVEPQGSASQSPEIE